MLVLAILFACTDEPTSPEPLSTRTAAETADTIGPRPDTVFNSFLVAFSDEVGDPAALSAELTEEVGGYRYYVYRYVVKGFAVANLSAEALSALEAHPLVRYVEEVLPLRMDEVQDVSADPDLWGLDWVDEYARQLDGAHYYFFPGTDSHIYILDTGIAGGHQEFTGRLGNGVTRLSWSWDADPYHDQDGHGTAVASVAGGTTVGVAKQATLHSVRINDNGNAHSDDIIAGLDWVAEYHVKPAVANLSYSTDGSYFLAEAMQGVLNAGVMLTTSAGSGGGDEIGDDACDDSGIDHVPGALVVSATRKTDYRASWANWGPCVDLFAPGGDSVKVAWIEHNADYHKQIGTSFSAPMVAGLVANLHSDTRRDPAQVHSIVTGSATAGELSNVGSGSPNLLMNSLFRHAVIAGPNSVESSNESTTETWRANTWGGDGSWTYLWEERVDGGPWSTVGTDQSYTRTIEAFASYDLELRASATSFGATRTSRLLVTVREGESDCTSPDGEPTLC